MSTSASAATSDSPSSRSRTPLMVSTKRQSKHASTDRSQGASTGVVSATSPSPSSPIVPISSTAFPLLSKDEEAAEKAEKQRRMYRLSLLVFDAPVIVLGILAFFGGIALGIGLYFGLLQRENQEIYNGLIDEAFAAKNELERNAAKAATNAVSMARLIGLRGINITFEEFSLFSGTSSLNETDVSVNGFAFAGWYPRVTSGNWAPIQAFVQEQLDTTGLGITFILKVTNPATGLLVPTSVDSKIEFYPAAYNAPLAPTKTAIGFDLSSSPARNGTIHNVIATGQLSITPRMFIASDDPKTAPYAQLLLTPVRSKDGSEFLGLCGNALRVRELANVLGGSAFVTIFDSTGGSNDYLHTTDGDWAANVLTHDPTQEKLLWDTLVAMEQARTIPLRTSVKVVDRTWSIFLTPNPSFVTNHRIDQSGKWVGLFLSIFGGIVLATAAVCVVGIKRILYTATITALMTNRIEDLQNTRDKMDALIEKLSREENRIRSVMNFVPTSILLVNEKGQITYANYTFLQTYQYAELSIEHRTLSLKQLLPSIELPALIGDKKLAPNGISLLKTDRQIVRMTAKTSFGVDRSTRVCFSWHGISGALSRKNGGRQILKNGANRSSGLGNCFVVVLFDSNHDSVSLSSEGKSPRHHMAQQSHSLPMHTNDTSLSSTQDAQEAQNAAFYAMLYEHEDADNRRLYVEFQEFCEAEHSSEVLQFFQAVIRFKSVEKFMQRVELQMQIIADFLEDGAPHQLNLSHEKLSTRMPKLRETLGQLDVFDELLEMVLVDLRMDLFDRFWRFNKSMGDQMLPNTIAIELESITSKEIA